jgi:4-hydroxy-tetrahydrodipicolinate reductase
MVREPTLESEAIVIRLAVAGAAGRMGRNVLELAAEDDRFEIAAALTRADDPQCRTALAMGRSAIHFTDRLAADCDVLIDFTVGGTLAWLDVCSSKGIAMVIGATGHKEAEGQRIREAAKRIPIVLSGNFSTGIAVIQDCLAALAKKLGDEYDVEIVETHHRRKVDAPSGTALLLADSILTATGKTRAETLIFGRQGNTGPRHKGQIGVHAVRMGDVVGQHEIHFSGLGETLTIRHAAHSREVFSAGALRAAAWVYRQKPGLFGMKDVLA